MNEKNPYNLTNLAFENRELDKLLLGENPYKYMTKFFPGSGDSDISTLIVDGIFPYILINKEKETIDYLSNTLHELSLRYDGLPPMASFMLCCAIHKKNNGKMPMNINFEKLLKEMMGSINQYKIQLKNDSTGEGWRNEEGLYGNLKRLSKITTEMSGLNFFPEENQQDEGVKM